MLIVDLVHLTQGRFKMAELATGVARPSTSYQARSPHRILIVEDTPHFAIGLRNNLEFEGYAADIVPDVARALRRIRQDPPSLILLDIMLPDKDGYELIRTVRDEGVDIPIVVLTARRDETDKLRGFGLGADDFVTKPVSILELIARIRAVLRRTQSSGEPAPVWIRFGDVEIHPPTRTVRRANAAVDLRPKEYDLLLALLHHRGRVVSRAELLRDVWGYHCETVSRTVDTHMAGLRAKLEANPFNPRFLITVRSVGYMLREQGDGNGDIALVD
jgi:DNA-binding response OmpR family regulator